MLGSGFVFLQLPEEALEGFTADPQHFAAAVVDVAMPRLDAPELVRRMLELRSDLPVLMVSRYIRPKDQRLIEQLGIREL